MPTTRQELCELFEIKVRAVKETMKAACIDPSKLTIDDSELQRFTRARELLTGPTSITYEQVRLVIGEEFKIKQGDTSEPRPESELRETCLVLGNQIADKIAENAEAIAVALLPTKLEQRLRNPASPLNMQVDRLSRNIYESTIDINAIAQEALLYARQEQLILDAPEVKMLSS